MTALFIMNLVSTFAHFMIAFLRILVIYGKWEALKTLVSMGHTYSKHAGKCCLKIIFANYILEFSLLFF